MAVNSAARQQGFILAAVLWALAVMFIVVSIFHAYVARKLAVGLQAKAHIQQQLDNISTEQTLLYLLSTSRMTVAGLSFSPRPEPDSDGFDRVDAVGDELYLDGTVYQGLNDVRFSLQDESGLLSLNTEDGYPVIQYLTSLGVDKARQQHLLDSLNDYIDANDSVRLSGAEARDYASANLPPPANDFLRSAPELSQVMGWREWLQEHPEVDLVNEFSASRVSLINFNTMPEKLLVKFIGVPPPLAEELVRTRKTNPFTTVEDFMYRAKLDKPIDPERYRFFPSSRIHLTIWNAGGGQARVISLQLTPNGLLGPWLVDYEYSVQSVDENNEALAIRQSTLFGHPLGDERRGH